MTRRRHISSPHPFILSLLIALMLASCSYMRQEAAPFSADTTGTDSTALRVAVMPAMACLPVFYALRSGLSDSLGIDIRLLRYQAQMDIDTAILHGHADIAFTDLIRTERLASQTPLTPFAACSEPLSLISLATKRVTRINQMKEQMIAISRLSATDYWCDHILDSLGINHDDIYRPQINDVCLRAEMLRQGLLDAAIMGEPFATWMTELGHRRLFRTNGRTQLFVWAACDSATDSRHTSFRHLLDSATVLLNDPSQSDILRSILREEYHLPAALTDTLELPQPTRPTDIRPADINEARKWLDSRKQAKK